MSATILVSIRLTAEIRNVFRTGKDCYAPNPVHLIRVQSATVHDRPRLIRYLTDYADKKLLAWLSVHAIKPDVQPQQPTRYTAFRIPIETVFIRSRPLDLNM